MELPRPGEGATSTPPAQKAWLKYKRIAQTQLDRTVIFPTQRWAFFAISLLLYCIRVYFLHGFYIVTYMLGIYLLNLFIGFLSPAFDPDEMDDDGPILPTGASSVTEERSDGEFRPFSRKLPEFKFWVAGTRMVWISIFMTFFSVFDLPVFWPILLMYFILLVFITMKDRVAHMIKYKYVPFSWGKQTYRDIAKVSATGVPPGGAGGGGGKDNK
ncbi:unnamed protein product [Amoebophrya sp. A120]|nr:unnamed protein product [Amoebophrya sp. A120]|eukprot:GSA120T00023739001.1